MTAKTSILLVDDDAEITELLGEYLTRFNYEVHCASDGPSMREQLRRNNVDLVVLDIMLPGADGLMLAREIRRQTRTPIIMLTARHLHPGPYPGSGKRCGRLHEQTLRTPRTGCAHPVRSAALARPATGGGRGVQRSGGI